MITFIKLGGSLITDKRVEGSFRADVMDRLADEIAAILDARPDMQLIVGHGSGSFGHFAAQRHGTMQGVRSPDDWRGFAEVAGAAADLNHRVSQSLLQHGIPAFRLQPSASALCRDGVLEQMALHPIQTALEHRLVPLIYGDVAMDAVRGGTIISTESVIGYIARRMPSRRVLLLGEVDGVYDRDGTVIPGITPDNLDSYRDTLGGSGGTDVTGGMLSKVLDMIDLAAGTGGMQVQVMSGLKPGLLQSTLLGEASPGTRISAE